MSDIAEDHGGGQSGCSRANKGRMTGDEVREVSNRRVQHAVELCVLKQVRSGEVWAKIKTEEVPAHQSQ